MKCSTISGTRSRVAHLVDSTRSSSSTPSLIDGCLKDDIVQRVVERYRRSDRAGGAPKKNILKDYGAWVAKSRPTEEDVGARRSRN